MSSSIVTFDSSVLLNYYSSQLAQSALFTTAAANAAPSAQSASSGTSSSSSSSSSSAGSGPGGTPPWNLPTQTTQQLDSEALTNTPFFSLDAPTLQSVSSQGPNAEDNQRLFAMYQAVQRMDTLAQMASDPNTVSGQLTSLDQRFQQGISSVTQFLQQQTFDNLTVLPGFQTSHTTSSAAIPLAQTAYSGGAVVKGDVSQAVPGLTGNETFTVNVTKGGTTTAVPIDLSNVQGPLNLDNIASYANSQLQAAGFSTRLHRTQIGNADANGVLSFGLTVAYSGSEKVSLTPDTPDTAVYVAGNAGTGADASGRLVKFDDTGSGASAVFNTSVAPNKNTVQVPNPTPITTTASDGATTTSTTTTETVPGGTLTVQSSAIDSQGNVYVVGETTGNMGTEINQASTQDATLAKYNSSGQLVWSKLLGATDTASGYAVAVDGSDNVVVAGSTDSQLSPDSVGGGTDSFVAKYTSDGTEVFTTQVDPVANDSARAVTIGSDGSIYVAGQVNGTMAAGQTDQGGADIYVRKLDSQGNVVYTRQYGSSGTDTPSQIALTGDGGLVVSSVQNGQGVVTKFDASSASSAPIWQVNLGDLQAGTMSGLAVQNGQVYVSGSTGNANLTAGGQAAIKSAFNGASDAFVFNISDNGTSATPNYVSYVGTSGADRGGGIAATDSGIYLTGATYGQFAGSSAPQAGSTNMFLAKLETDGTVDWTKQYGGLDGQSSGVSVNVDSQGASVLDNLGLPRGTLSNNEPSDLLSQSTVRAGDYFSVKVSLDNGTVNQQRITIDPGETISSLANKINAVLGQSGTAKATFSENGQALEISANTKQDEQIQLIPGDGDFDALAGLGISTRLLINKVSTQTTTSNAKVQDNAAVAAQAAAANQAKVVDNAAPLATVSADQAKNVSQKTVVSLGLLPENLLSTASAKSAATAMDALLAQIRTTYRQLNDPSFAALTSGTSSTPNFSSSGSGSVSPEISAQLAGYQSALQRLSAGSSSSGSTSSLLVPISA